MCRSEHRQNQTHTEHAGKSKRVIKRKKINTSGQATDKHKDNQWKPSKQTSDQAKSNQVNMPKTNNNIIDK